MSEALNIMLAGGYFGFIGFDVDALTSFPAGIIGWIMMAFHWKSNTR